MSDKYELTNYDKRRILLNNRLEESSQALRKATAEIMYADLSPEEQAEWEQYINEVRAKD